MPVGDPVFVLNFFLSALLRRMSRGRRSGEVGGRATLVHQCNCFVGWRIFLAHQRLVPFCISQRLDNPTHSHVSLKEQRCWELPRHHVPCSPVWRGFDQSESFGPNISLKPCKVYCRFATDVSWMLLHLSCWVFVIAFPESLDSLGLLVLNFLAMLLMPSLDRHSVRCVFPLAWRSSLYCQSI